MKYYSNVFLVSLVLLFLSCSKGSSKLIVTVKNTLSIDRQFETVELSKEQLNVKDLSLYAIKDIDAGEFVVSQTVDLDGDGIMDQLLFQPKINVNSEKKFEVVVLPKDNKPKANVYCYSRFVPERTDDYAWENDRVAFRTYGPTAQKMVEENIKGGTLSSGIDAWLKRVDYPIINNWYKKETETEGTYHEDTGEGLDNFHVGISRGVGGIAVKEDSVFHYSKNFIKWRTITSGPLRTSFYLEYANWKVGSKEINESKIISLDYGSNLSKFETTISGTETISAGLTLHENDGEVTANNQLGFISYWQPHTDSELGTAIVTKNNYFAGQETYETTAKDESNAYLHLHVIDNKTIYYAGFTWKKSNQFKDKLAWGNYLNEFSTKINNPLLIEIKK
ncbi:DUF4861 domain-containing protein [Polaribacter sp. BAL334]|uniref:DUF4861 family protein n=1 Tax=Polaribacter sp. BAL334 TaxID=1708178 RepID=UPI0018D23132|nr:DUF4861 family protein [Polaribacter sp. BAL334]MBG7611231.1 DUF4861 domain-containing protein [Polaribacter sp. BAL334]